MLQPSSPYPLPANLASSFPFTPLLDKLQEGRSRFRFLSHLPLTCQIVLCELNLKPPLLSKATLEEFAGASVTQCSCDPLLSDSTQ